MKSGLYTLIIALFFIFSCGANSNSSKSTTDIDQNVQKSKQVPDTITTPAGFIKMYETSGDLDKDNVEEKVIVYNTNAKSDMGSLREIHILKNDNGQWKLWHKSKGAVLPSEHGGLSGDPFRKIDIKNSTLVIDQSGGSRDKWNFKHIYRFQNNKWKLIGATIINETPCMEKNKLDYNLSTGKAIFLKEILKCDTNGKLKSSKKQTINITKKLKELPDMDGYYPGDNEFEIDGTEDIIYY